MSLRLLIVDDNTQFLMAARCLLKNEGIDVVGVASTSADALRFARSLHPDVTLVDVDLGDESGLDLAATLSEAEGETLRVILTSAYSEQDLAELIEASPAVGFLPKTQLSARAILDLLDATGDDGVA